MPDFDRAPGHDSTTERRDVGRGGEVGKSRTGELNTGEEASVGSTDERRSVGVNGQSALERKRISLLDEEKARANAFVLETSSWANRQQEKDWEEQLSRERETGRGRERINKVWEQELGSAIGPGQRNDPELSGRKPDSRGMNHVGLRDVGTHSWVEKISDKMRSETKEPLSVGRERNVWEESTKVEGSEEARDWVGVERWTSGEMFQSALRAVGWVGQDEVLRVRLLCMNAYYHVYTPTRELDLNFTANLFI